ncbi:MAG: 50S ribosomal protein L17 [Flavobacteriaceae bacterium]|nr:50S ribosomal protein L17 [Flavobacteriaceae bacterium]
MRHRKKIIALGRKVGHRKLMLSNIACSLIEHKSINTTTTKAKALQRFIEPIITKSKSDTIHNRRLAFKLLRNKRSVTELFNEVSTKVGDRPGGYTRIIKLGNRLGDNAEMAMIELIDYNDLYKAEKQSKTARTRRSRRSGRSLISSDLVEPSKQLPSAKEETSE